MQQGLGIETRRPYIAALSNSGLVTLEEIDRILKTHYSRLQDERTEAPRSSERTPSRMSRMSERDEPATSFATFESAAQFVLGYLGKEDLQDLCDELDMPVSGNKEDLVFRILGDPSFTPEMALSFVDKEGLKEICQELGLRTQGVREELEERIRRAIATRRREQPARSPYQPVAQNSYTQPLPTAPPPSVPPQQPTHLASHQDLVTPHHVPSEPPPLEFPETPPSTLNSRTCCPSNRTAADGDGIPRILSSESAVPQRAILRD